MTTANTIQMDLGTSDVSTPSGGGDAPSKVAKAKKKLAPKKKAGRRVHVRADLAPGGALHVRSMGDVERDVNLEGVAVTLADDENKPVWIQLAKPGTFRGHPSGPFELNDKVFAEIIANFKATENRHIPVDFEHASEADATAGSIPDIGAPAHGWIVDLKTQGGQLFGLVEWGPLAREYIKAKKYKWFSPAIRFNARDRVTGKPIGARMTSGGLTNNPFLDGMMPLAAKDGAINTPCGDLTVHGAADAIATMRLAYSPAEYMPRLRCILCMSELSTAAECADQLERLQEHFDAADQDPGASHEGIALGRFVYPLRGLVGATLSATWDDVFAAAASLIEAAGGETDDDEAPDSVDFASKDTGGATVATDTHPTNDAGHAAGENSMTPEQIAAMNADLAETKHSLKDTTVKLTAAEAKATDTEAKLAEVALSLKAETAKREEADLELKTLRDEKTAREAKDLTDRVTLAFDTYKDAQKLTEIDREFMLVNLKSMPDKFELKYPRVAPAQQHLLKNFTEGRPAGAQVVVGDDGGSAGGAPVNMAKAARQLSAQKGIPLAEAQRVLMRASQPKVDAR